MNEMLSNNIDYLFSCKHKELPDTDITYSIGDLHGMLEQTCELVGFIYDDIKKKAGKTYKIIFHGDFVDRGLNSKAVLDYLMRLEKEDKNVFFLMGNHDQMLLQYCEEYVYAGYRTSYPETFDSFVDTNYTIPDHYIKWISKLHVAFEDSKRIYVHAGINPHKTIQNTSECIWIRNEFLNYPWDFKKIVVHGHTPDESGPVFLNNRVNVDTGAFFSGILSCAVFEGDNYTILQSIGKPIARFRN